MMDDDSITSVTLTKDHLDLLALAMDRLCCDMDIDSPLAPFAMSLFMFFDELAEEAFDETDDLPSERVIDRKDNLIFVDFGSKED